MLARELRHVRRALGVLAIVALASCGEESAMEWSESGRVGSLLVSVSPEGIAAEAGMVLMSVRFTLHNEGSSVVEVPSPRLRCQSSSLRHDPEFSDVPASVGADAVVDGVWRFDIYPRQCGSDTELRLGDARWSLYTSSG